MTEYYVRPGPNDLAPYASGANDGSSYTNAFRGLNNATFRTLVNTTSDDVFWICGEHAALQSGTTTYRFSVAPGLSKRKPKIIRLDYPGDPGTMWGGYISTATWTETSGGSQIWTATMLVTAASYDDEGTCPYAAFFNGTERRILARRATQGECDSEENTFYLTGTTCRVHLGAGEDPNGNKIMLAQYGHRVQYMRSDTHMKHVYFHGGAVHPLGRLAMTDGSGLFLSPRNVTWNGQKILHGATHLFPLRRTRNLTVKNAEVGKLAGHGAFYAYITTVDDFGTTLASTEARRPEYNNKNLRIENTKLHTIGVYSRQDGHLVGLQAIEMFTLRGADLSWAPSAFVMWHSNEPVCRCSEIHLSYVGMHHIWSGEGAAATTAKPLRAFATESGTHQDADFSNRTLEYFWIGGIAGVGVEPLHPQIGLRLQNNNPNGHFVVQHGKVVDTPCAVVMPQNAPYLYYDDIEVINPAGHSTHNVYATVEANQWTTAHADGFTFSGLADPAQFFALRGLTAETVALTTYLSQTTVTDAAGSYRFFGASTFGVGSALLRPDGGYILRPDGGHILRP